jgi:hypothetical protein
MKHGVRADGDHELVSDLLKTIDTKWPGIDPGPFCFERLQRGECSIACQLGLSNISNEVGPVKDC